MQRAEPRCARRTAPLPMVSGDCSADSPDVCGASPSPRRERDQTPSVPPRVLLDDLQFEEEGESPMGDAPTVTYSPPNTRRAQSAGGSSSTSAGDIPGILHPPQPPPSAAAAAAAAAGEDCGECLNCKDKPKFGGPGTKRKGCLIRRETKPLRPSGLSVTVVGTPPVASMLANKSPKRDSLSTGGSVDSVSVGQTSDADEAGPAPVPLSAPSSDPNDDCGVCVTCLDKPKFGGRGIKRKGCLRKKEVTDATRSVAHPAHNVDVDDDAPASRSTDKPREAACETPATVDALAGQPPSSGAASKEPRAYEQRLRLRAEARGAGKRAASGLSVCSTYSAGAASSSAVKSDGDDSEAEEAPEKEYEAGTDGTPDAPPGEDYAAVHLIGEGLTETDESGSPRAPLNELSINRDVPGTPQLKTPDLEVAAGGVSPLSEFANILEVTPNLRLPEQARPANL